MVESAFAALSRARLRARSIAMLSGEICAYKSLVLVSANTVGSSLNGIKRANFSFSAVSWPCGLNNATASGSASSVSCT